MHYKICMAKISKSQTYYIDFITPNHHTFTYIIDTGSFFFVSIYSTRILKKFKQKTLKYEV